MLRRDFLAFVPPNLALQLTARNRAAAELYVKPFDLRTPWRLAVLAV